MTKKHFSLKRETSVQTTCYSTCKSKCRVPFLNEPSLICIREHLAHYFRISLTSRHSGCQWIAISGNELHTKTYVFNMSFFNIIHKILHKGNITLGLKCRGKTFDSPAVLGYFQNVYTASVFPYTVVII